MKKFKFILALSTLLALVGCQKVNIPTWDAYDHSAHSAAVSSDGYTLIDIYGLNDFHGALARIDDSNHPGVARLNKFLINKRDENKGGTVFLASGDMWQGSADSNITRGKIVNESMNYMGFEAMAIGNHEYDWGQDQIRANKAESDFAYLGANIVKKSDKENPDYVDPSFIITRDDINIGVIGVMGSELEYTIQGSLIADLEFDLINKYVAAESARLRSDGADFIVLLAHDSWTEGELDADKNIVLEDKTVDVVLAGHQHAYDNRIVNGIPILQTRGYGQQVMHVQFGVNKDTKDVRVETYTVIEDINAMNLTEDKISKQIYDYYYQEFEIDNIKKEKLGKILNQDMDRSAIANFTVYVMQQAYAQDGVVAALHNVNGGIRVSKFSKGTLTYGMVYQALPFDNEIYIVEMRGSRFIELFSRTGNYAYYFDIDQNDVVDSDVYKVATISFVYESKDSPLGNVNFTNMFEYPRDLIADYMRTHETIDGRAFDGGDF